MVKLDTPYGICYVLSRKSIVSVGPCYKANAKYKTPTRPVTMTNGKVVYIKDTPENMAALVGEDYQPDKPVKVVKRKANVSQPRAWRKFSQPEEADNA